MDKAQSDHWYTVIGWILAITILVIVIIIYMFLRGYLGEIGSYFKNWWKF